MNKKALIKKYKHRLTLKNYSGSFIQSYLNGRHKFPRRIQYSKNSGLGHIQNYFFLECPVEEVRTYINNTNLHARVLKVFEKYSRPNQPFDCSPKRLTLRMDWAGLQ
jgi:hypothetical protein